MLATRPVFFLKFHRSISRLDALPTTANNIFEVGALNLSTRALINGRSIIYLIIPIIHIRMVSESAESAAVGTKSVV